VKLALLVEVAKEAREEDIDLAGVCAVPRRVALSGDKPYSYLEQPIRDGSFAGARLTMQCT
jgi:hypothetical protein